MKKINRPESVFTNNLLFDASVGFFAKRCGSCMETHVMAEGTWWHTKDTSYFD